MAKVKFASLGEHIGIASVRNVINYCMKEGRVLACNTFLPCAAEEFLAIQRYFGYDTTAETSIFHLVIAFSYEECFTSEKAIAMLPKIVGAIAFDHQIIAGVHSLTHSGRNNKHIHVAINPVGFRNGAVFPTDYRALGNIRKHAYDVLHEFRNYDCV